jgi:GTP-binding GTPase N-terminal/GTP-binding GTPase Middle Region
MMCWQLTRVVFSLHPARFVLPSRSWKLNCPSRAILVGIQVPSVDDVAHAASIEELGHLVKTLGYEIVGTMSQTRDAIDGGTVLGKGRLAELAAITGGTGVVGSMAVLQKSKARERFENADVKKPDAPQIETDPEAPPRPEFVIVDHEISPSQARNLERATGAQVLDRTGVIMEIFHRHAHSREAKLQVEIARLKYVSPRLRDMPASGRRFVQRVEGYEATLVAGTPIFERGEHTGAMPGRLVRAGGNRRGLHAANRRTPNLGRPDNAALADPGIKGRCQRRRQLSRSRPRRQPF